MRFRGNPVATDTRGSAKKLKEEEKCQKLSVRFGSVTTLPPKRLQDLLTAGGQKTPAFLDIVASSSTLKA